MTRFGFNLVLAVIWCLLTGSGNVWNFAAGMLIGALTVSACSQTTGKRGYLSSLARLLRFGFYFVRILTTANIQIAREVVTPGFTQEPAILRYPVGHLTPIQRVTLANAITLTPGTLVVDISPDDEWLYIHCMYARHRDVTIAEISELESRLMHGVFS